ncbi:MAG: hypothetical protein ACN4GK_04600 [Acidimicrobiia bacterium]
MKRIVRILSFAAGVAALIWAMRDRFISLALPREPQPPAFRHPEDHPNVPHRPHQPPHFQPEVPTTDNKPDDLQEIKGIGPVFAAGLADMGITTFGDLSESKVADVAAKLETAESRVADWIGQASQRL